jgi:AcrR family transcriptional regulator
MTVPATLVAAAVAEARQRNQDVADVQLTAIAAAAGISRSTLVRRIGGSRRALDDAVRATGVDPGGRPPVRERAIEAAAGLIAEHGLSAVTLEAIATAAECSQPSLHAAFGGRDGLLTAIFERYSPLLELEALMADRPASVEDTVRGVYRAFIRAFEHEKQVLPALLADVFSRPQGPGRRMLAQNFPRLLASFGAWLQDEMRNGRIRKMPLPLIAQLLLGPMAIHMLTRPAFAPLFGPAFPTPEQAAAAFTEAFLAAACADREEADREKTRRKAQP